MTVVLRIEKINFSDKVRNGSTVRGIDGGGLVALKKHNERQEVNHRLEMKSKQATHIDNSRSHGNRYFKRLGYEEINKLKAKEHRSNSVGAFELVVDFQDLSSAEIEHFDVLEHKTLIEAFIQQQNIGNSFELLSFVYHADEKNPHYHLIFSGWNEQAQAFNFNEVFNPKVEGEPICDEDGNLIHFKHNRGKLKGQYMLDEQGQKIPKKKTERINGAQHLQDDWAAFLKADGQRYRHKKKFSSALHFPKHIWQKFDETTKERVYLVRRMEIERMRLLIEENFKAFDELETLLKNEVFAVMNAAYGVQTTQAVRRAEKGKKTPKYAPIPIQG